MAGGAVEHGVLYGVEGGPICLWEACAYRVGSAIGDERNRREQTFDNGTRIDGDFLGSEAEPGGGGGIDSEDGGRTAEGVVDAVLHVDHTFLGLDGDSDTLRGGGKQIWIVVEQLDLDGLRCIGEIVDHVFKYLDELYVEDRLLLLDVGSDVGDHIFDVAAPLGFELDRDVSRVSFCHGCQSHLQAGAAGCALNFRNVFENGFNVLEDAIRFFERAASRHDVVDHKTALVHCREKIGTESFVTEEDGNKQHAAGDEKDQRFRQRTAEPFFVKVEDVPHKALLVFVVLLMTFSSGFFKQEGGKRGRPGEGQQQRREQRDRHGEGQRAEEAARNARYCNQR